MKSIDQYCQNQYSIGVIYADDTKIPIEYSKIILRYNIINFSSYRKGIEILEKYEVEIK